MNAPVASGYSPPDARNESVTLPARPEPLRLSTRHRASTRTMRPRTENERER